MSNLQIFIALTVWLFPIVLNIYVDRNRKKPFYLVVNILRGIAMILHAGLFFNVQGGYFNWDDVVRNTPIFTYQITSYWLLFELGLNWVWGERLLYYDSKEGDSGWVDGFFKKHPKLHTPTKVTALIVCILSIIAIYHTK